MTVGLFGTAVFYGDGVITPAISVLSAVEGLEVVAPALHHAVIPDRLGWCWTLLFAVAALLGAGRHRQGLFGPVTLLLVHHAHRRWACRYIFENPHGAGWR